MPWGEQFIKKKKKESERDQGKEEKAYCLEWTSAVTVFSKEEKVKVAQSCLPLCDPMDCIVHEVLQARILEWVSFPFSRGSSKPRDGTQVSRFAGRFFTS